MTEKEKYYELSPTIYFICMQQTIEQINWYIINEDNKLQHIRTYLHIFLSQDKCIFVH